MKPKILILHLRHVPTVDAPGLSALENVFSFSKKDGSHIILSGLQSRPLRKIKRSGLLRYIEDNNSQPTIDHAINRTQPILQESKSQWN